MSTQMNLEQRIRDALTGKECKRICAEVGIDESQKSRILSGGAGITIDKMDAWMKAIGFVAVGVNYLNAVGELCKVGANCDCARRGFGECGSR